MALVTAFEKLTLARCYPDCEGAVGASCCYTPWQPEVVGRLIWPRLSNLERAKRVLKLPLGRGIL